MKLTVVLGASQEASFDISLNDNFFTRKWVKELRWCLSHCEFDQQEAFSTHYSLEESANLLHQSCVTINQYLKNFIDIKSDILDQSQEYFNYLHSKFEILSGEFDKPTRLFRIANQELKDAIRQLNCFVHRVEGKYPANSSLNISFNKDQYRRSAFEINDYEYFQFSFPKGTLYLHYAELGKEFIDLYEDNLSIDYAGFKNLHYYSGEASIEFTDYSAFDDLDYLNWLHNQGIDPYNKLLGHGKIPLGTVDNLTDAENKIMKHKHIHSILIKE
jgi:hypothetical protein